MKLRKLDIAYIDALTADADLKGACLVLPGTLNAHPELNELPRLSLPGVIICNGCNAFLERLLNEKGVAVTRPSDPVDSIGDGTEVEVDLVGGTLTELSSGRKFALKPLKPSHLKFVRAHG